MAQIKFNYRVDMNNIEGPQDPSGFIVGYDLDGSLKQKDYYGNIVVISGTSNIGLQGPQGPQGVPGPVGPTGLTWSGAWIATQSYFQNYAVGYASASWWCISDIIGATSNSSPDLDNIHWALLAAQGSPGTQGIQGIQGIPGIAGPTGPKGPTTSNFYLSVTTTDAQDDKLSNIWRDGYIGLGISSPSASIHSYVLNTDNNIVLEGTQSASILFKKIGATGLGLFVDDQGLYVRNQSISKVFISNDGNLEIGTYSTGNRFIVTSMQGTASFIINDQGDSIFRGGLKINGQTFSVLPPGSIAFNGQTSIYSPNDAEIIIGTDRLSSYNYNYGWKFDKYKIQNLWDNPIEIQNTIGTVDNLWIGSNYIFAGYGTVPSQKSTLLIKGTTSSVLKIVPSSATWSSSTSLFEVFGNGQVYIGGTFSSAFYSILSVNGDTETKGDFYNTKTGGGYLFYDGVSGMYDNSGGILFRSYTTNDIFQFIPMYPGFVSDSNIAQRVMFQEYSIIASSGNTSVRMIELAPTINKTGTASGVDRGIYINPTLVSDVNKFRSIETTNGQVIFNSSGSTSSNVIIGATDSMNSMLFINRATSSTTIGNNIILDLYNSSDSGVVNVLSELAFSARGQIVTSDPYNIGHRYAVISGYATTWDSLNVGGGLIFSTRATTGSSLTEKMRISPNGDVAIGTSSPSTKLHVFATQSGAFRLQDGTQANGYILTSDSNGVGTWTASTTVAVITTTSSITTNTLDDSGFNQRGRCVIINNGTYSVNITVDATSGFSSTYIKHGTASISFVQGSGRTLVQVDGTLNLNGSVGSTATIISYGTTDYLRINNA